MTSELHEYDKDPQPKGILAAELSAIMLRSVVLMAKYGIIRSTVNVGEVKSFVRSWSDQTARWEIFLESGQSDATAATQE